MAKKAKATPNSETKPKDVVISFRLTDAQEQVLKDDIENNPAMGIHSTRQLCRKFAVDYMAGRLQYKNPKDREKDLELYPTA